MARIRSSRSSTGWCRVCRRASSPSAVRATSSSEKQGAAASPEAQALDHHLADQHAAEGDQHQAGDPVDLPEPYLVEPVPYLADALRYDEPVAEAATHDGGHHGQRIDVRLDLHERADAAEDRRQSE